MSSIGKDAMQTQINLHTNSLDRMVVKFLFNGESKVSQSISCTQASDANLQIDIEKLPQDSHQDTDELLELEILMRPA